MPDLRYSLDQYFCSIASVLGTEESRISKARSELPKIATKYDSLLDQFRESIQRPSPSLQNLVYKFARDLLANAIANDEGNPIIDDRPLYWARLMARAILGSNRDLKPAQQSTLIHTLEDQSRQTFPGSDENASKTDRNAVVLTSFDPFHLDRRIAQSNSSSAITLSLAKGRISGHPLKIMVFPVRFNDFDEGMVEAMFEPVFKAKPRLVLTISMGRKDIDLERFPSKNRSAPNPDNDGAFGTVDGERSPCLKEGPEFVEFSLPAQDMTEAAQELQVNDNRTVETVEQGRFDATSLAQLDGQTAIEGSGGGFLSNEISYRTLLLQKELGLSFPLGHVHVPRVTEHDPEVAGRMVRQTRLLIEAALKATAAKPT